MIQGIEVNKESHGAGEVWTVLVPEGRVAVVFCLNATDSGLNARQPLVYNWGGLTNPDVTNPRAIRTTDRAAILFYPGTWTIQTGDEAVAEPPLPKEDYLVIYLDNLESAIALVSLMGSSALNKVDLLRWGTQAVSSAVNADADDDFDDELFGPIANVRQAILGAAGWERWSGRNADAAGDFAAALFGAITNARLGVLSRAAADYVRLMADLGDAIGGINPNLLNFLYTGALMLGVDTSGTEAMRRVEARIFGAGAINEATIPRLGVDTVVRSIDGAGTTTRPCYHDVPSAIFNGRAAANVRNLWTLGVQTKSDVPGSLLVPTAMSRTVETTSATAAVGAVIATLDCRSHPLKNLWVTAGEVSTVDVQVSHDGTTWVTILAAFATAVGTVFPLGTALLLEQVKAFRHIRILAGAAGFAAPVTGVISAMGG